jgi:Histidine kinase-, DNA gyrase B-, and HSP90-like ATPase
VSRRGLIVRGDPLLLERVVENLLSNAAKYTPAGSWVHVSANRDGEQTVVAVTDGGPGIPRHEIRNLGQRFFRGGEAHTRETRGTGLGLALVREILVLHGTELEIQSEVGVGSRFSFRLPGDTSALAASSGEASASAVGTSLASQARQLSFDDLLLSTIAARAVAPDEVTVEASEQPQSRASKLGAAAVATAVTATSSLAVTGALPDHAQDVVAAALTSIGVSSSLADGSERAWPPRPASPSEDALSGRDQSGSGGERTGGGDGGGTSTGGSAGGSTGGTASSGGSSGGGGSGGGGSGGGGSGGGSGGGGSGGPGGSGDAPGQTGDAGHSGDAPGQNKDGGRNGGNGPRGGKGSTKRPLRPSTSSPTSR